MSRFLPLFCLLALSALSCKRAASPQEPQGPEAPPLEVKGMEAAPAAEPVAVADEIPAFLREGVPDVPTAVDLDDDELDSLVEGLDEREPTLAELMARVSVTGRDDDGPPPQVHTDDSLEALMASVKFEDDDSHGDSWAYLDGAVPFSPPGGDAPDPSEDREAPTEPEAPKPAAAEEDPCAPLRHALAQHRDYLLRVGAERDAFGYVEQEADSNALRLLQGLRRCGSNPGDPDCRPPPVEVDISELEVPAHQIARDPSELEAEHRHPDDVPHDRVSLDLLHKLRACERTRIAQPLLQRSP